MLTFCKKCKNMKKVTNTNTLATCNVEMYTGYEVEQLLVFYVCNDVDSENKEENKIDI